MAHAQAFDALDFILSEAANHSLRLVVCLLKYAEQRQ